MKTVIGIYTHYTNTEFVIYQCKLVSNLLKKQQIGFLENFPRIEILSGETRSQALFFSKDGSQTPDWFNHNL